MFPGLKARAVLSGHFMATAVCGAGFAVAISLEKW
jgi:hypothetical protein